MTGWVAKRFWREVGVEPVDGGYTLRLDARSLRTPAKAPFVVPTHALAEAAAEEWRAQDGQVDPRRMPVTRSANAAIDKVGPQFDAVADMLAAYAETDLLCQRAEAPQALAAREAAAWDPALAWAEATLGLRLAVGRGVIAARQEAAALARARALLAALHPFELTAMHDLVALSGSLVLALGVAHGFVRPEDAWATSRIEEDWQAELWGHDDEAAAAADVRRRDFLHAARFLALARATA